MNFIYLSRMIRLTNDRQIFFAGLDRGITNCCLQYFINYLRAYIHTSWRLKIESGTRLTSATFLPRLT